MGGRFSLVTPAHNEAAQVEALVETVRSNSLQPDRWLVIDDRSEDGTGDRFREHGKDLPYLEVHRLEHAGDSPAMRISEVLSAGMKKLGSDLGGTQYVGILDADIRAGDTYWQQLVEHMDANPRLGICSGALWFRDELGQRILEGGQRVDLPRGGLRLIRKECLQEAGIIVRCCAWDPVMTIRARSAGWSTELLPSVLAETARPTGQRIDPHTGGIAYGQRDWNLGRPMWQMGMLSAAAALSGRPSAALGRLQGWFGQAFSGGERLDDSKVRRYYREERPREWASAAWGKITGQGSPYRYLPKGVVEEDEVPGAT